MKKTQSNPYRFDWSRGIAVREEPNGSQWVQFSDYERLKEENESLRKKIMEMKHEVLRKQLNL